MVLALVLAGCAARLNTVPVSLMTRSEDQFLAAVGQLLQAGDITDQAAVERFVGEPLVFARGQSALFGQARFFRPAPGSEAARHGVVWETIAIEQAPGRPTRVASLEIMDLPGLLCVDEAAVTRRFAGYAINDSARAVTVHSGPGQEGEFYVRFTKGTGERCFVGVTFVQNSSRG